MCGAWWPGGGGVGLGRGVGLYNAVCALAQLLRCDSDSTALKLACDSIG